LGIKKMIMLTIIQGKIGSETGFDGGKTHEEDK
jgi:hypothetical protein